MLRSVDNRTPINGLHNKVQQIVVVVDQSIGHGTNRIATGLPAASKVCVEPETKRPSSPNN
jgi:hypothetical protein